MIVPNSIAMDWALNRSPFGNASIGGAGGGGTTDDTNKKTIFDWIPYILGGMTLGLAYISEKD